MSDKAYNKERYWWLKSVGICVRCGQEYAEPGKTCCIECAAKDAERRATRGRTLEEKQKAAQRDKARRDRLIASNICPKCGKKPLYRHNGHTYATCYECHIRQRRDDARRAEEGLRKRKGWVERGLCRFCGGTPAEGYLVCQSCLEELRRRAAKGAAAAKAKREFEKHPWARDETIRRAISSQKSAETIQSE